MPELAEVDFYRRQWDVGLGKTILSLNVRQTSRVFRGTEPGTIARTLRGSTLLTSECSGKQMLFEFSGGAWLGLHLGMSGELTVASAETAPGRHDHLVLVQRERLLIYRDPRMFGRVRFHQGSQPPDWWADRPPGVDSKEFTTERVRAFLIRHGRMPIKGVLLLQSGFPGIGNWMADEILWRAGIHPCTPAGRLDPDAVAALWRIIRFVCRGAMKHVGPEFGDPPAGWLFHERWREGGICPVHRTTLSRAPVSGRTTAWCLLCQEPPEPDVRTTPVSSRISLTRSRRGGRGVRAAEGKA